MSMPLCLVSVCFDLDLRSIRNVTNYCYDNFQYYTDHYVMA